ncbi:MAG: enoyl-CoA hydratase/isomerase family protein [Burkholderiales bacterium]|nr:enoyl-CoA hydratase/isomerase family protein [Burkholderiales bacterium]
MTEVSYARHGRVARIHMQLGSGLFGPATRRALHEALLRYKQDAEAWIAVVSSEGADFGRGSQDVPTDAGHERRSYKRLWAGGYVEVWKPTIAAIRGECRGESLALALSCDLRVADATARFAADFTGAAHEPDVLAAWLLSLVGAARTFELLWLGRTIDAEEARRIGLVNRLAVQGPVKALPPENGRFPMEAMAEAIAVPDGDALSAALRFADELLLYAPVTRNFQKEIAYRSIGVPVHYAQTLELGPNPYASTDRIEGTRAFVENRRPVWRNK